MKRVYKAGMYVRTHTQISIALQCQRRAESLCAPCWVSHHAFEYVWWMCWQSHRWRSIPYCLFCFMSDLRCCAIFFHFHTQVGRHKVHKNGGLLAECHYIFHLLSHHVTWRHLLAVGMFWWWGGCAEPNAEATTVLGNVRLSTIYDTEKVSF